MNEEKKTKTTKMRGECGRSNMRKGCKTTMRETVIKMVNITSDNE
jgi:YbbR domain-containing protein